MYKDQETLSAVLFHERVDSDDSFLNFSFPESPFRNADESNINVLDKMNEFQRIKYKQFIMSTISIDSQTDFPSTPLFGHIDDDGENHSMLSRDHE
jgi:DNA topoisomerase IB